MKHYITQQTISLQCKVTRGTVQEWKQRGFLPTPDARIDDRQDVWTQATVDKWRAKTGR